MILGAWLAAERGAGLYGRRLVHAAAIKDLLPIAPSSPDREGARHSEPRLIFVREKPQEVYR